MQGLPGGTLRFRPPAEDYCTWKRWKTTECCVAPILTGSTLIGCLWTDKERKFRAEAVFAVVLNTPTIRAGKTRFQDARHGVKPSVMQRFKPNDAVFILPKYAHLYSGNSAVVISVTEDPFRPMFNEYALEFPDGAIAKLFEFQVIEDVPHYKTFVASVLFDSRRQMAVMGVRGEPSSGGQIILQTPGFHLDMRIRANKTTASIMGQVFRRGAKGLLRDLDVSLLKEGMPITNTISDTLGVFKFSHVPRGSLNTLVVIPQYSSRILGAFLI